MPNPIPDFDYNLVLPPHLGDPVERGQLSPYPCTTVDLCQRLGTTPERRVILGKFLDFRDRLRAEGLVNGFQWLDGSFLEDVEARENRPPKDLDVVTVYWGYDRAFQLNLLARFPEVAHPARAKANFALDHYPFDAGYSPEFTLDQTRYWILLFSHTRLGVWKGMLKIELNTPAEDAAARQELAQATP
jgi:hypothetical protein